MTLPVIQGQRPPRKGRGDGPSHGSKEPQASAGQSPHLLFIDALGQEPERIGD